MSPRRTPLALFVGLTLLGPVLPAAAVTSSAVAAVVQGQPRPAFATAIQAHYAALGGGGSFLGAPVGDETPVAGGVQQTYAQGVIYWSPATGAWSMHGAILDHYRALGGPAGVLGFPTTDETGTPDGVGRFNHFTGADRLGASIYWTPATGAWSLHGAIRSRWAALGWECGPLGYPTSDETGVPDGVGRSNAFSAGGATYWSPRTGAWSVHGAIEAHYVALGGPTGVLGYPVTDETGTPDGIGRFNHFDGADGTGASIYWTARTGAWSIHGKIRQWWRFTGWEAGPYGYPTSDEHAMYEGRTEDLQYGTLSYDYAAGTVTAQTYVAVPGPMRTPTATVGHGTATLALQIPADGGSPITGYQYTIDGEITWHPLATAPGPTAGTLSGTVNGLTGGGSYMISVRAVNARGPGLGSPDVVVAPYFGTAPPAVVTDLSTMTFDGEVDLSFSPPAAGGGPLTGYQYSSDGGSTWQSFPSRAQLEQGRQGGPVTGLTNGVPYTFVVRALNGFGSGSDSNRVTTTPTAQRVSPITLRALPDDPYPGALHVSFDDPFPGGDRPTDFRRFEYTTDGSHWVPLGAQPSTDRVTGRVVYDALVAHDSRGNDITDGMTYTVAARVITDSNLGGESTAVSVTYLGPAVVPDRPSELDGWANILSDFSCLVTLQFLDPADGGVRITGFQYSTDEGTTWARLETSGSAQSPEVTSGNVATDSTPAENPLKPGTYTLWVRATNAVGAGEPASISVKIPAL
jgi:uncharacterized protein with LGFP repeats